MNKGYYKELIVRQKSMDLFMAVYSITSHFPKEEIYGLTAQIKRAVISIPSNIAEGSKRSSRKDFCHFLYTAYGSGAELETQIEIAKRLSFCTQEEFAKCESLLSEVMKMLNKLIDQLEIDIA